MKNSKLEAKYRSADPGAGSLDAVIAIRWAPRPAESINLFVAMGGSVR